MGFSQFQHGDLVETRSLQTHVVLFMKDLCAKKDVQSPKKANQQGWKGGSLGYLVSFKLTYNITLVTRNVTEQAKLIIQIMIKSQCANFAAMHVSKI